MTKAFAKDHLKRLLDIFLVAPGRNPVLTTEVDEICAAFQGEDFQPQASVSEKLKLISGSAAVLFGDRKWSGRVETQQAVARHAITKLGKLIDISP